ncbi:hypothetical protein N9850_01495 [Granulosicoccus sp.]|nr:hypothetical protein [Granulosicoccus sp.]MDB4222416.1 hypothetical protein [Granulosicoccus sp.]
MLHRPGNFQDTNGAKQLIIGCMAAVRERLSIIKIELRMDSAFFSDEIVKALDQAKVSYSISVPIDSFTHNFTQA